MEEWFWPPRYDDAYLPDSSQEHWFPVRETMSPDEREERILGRIRTVMTYAWEHAPFYRRKWEEAELHPNDMTSWEAFERVPPVTKRELREDQEANPPFGSYLCVSGEDVYHIHGTSGTTGRPTAFGINRADWQVIANAHARVMWAMGIRRTDSVFIASFFSLYMGSWGALAGAERLGATVFPFGAGAPGQTVRAARWLEQMRPTVLYSTPSYALYLADVATEEGIDPAELGLRIMFFSGEPGASIPAIREKLERAFGAHVYDSGSMAEVSPWMNLGQSRAEPAMLCWQDLVYTEVVDPETFRRVPYGEEGTPIYTTLERTSQPMIRLLSNDVTRWVAPPETGRTYPMLPRGIYGRLDDMITVRGENVFPSTIDEVVMALPDYGGEHRIVVSRMDTMDELVVQVEVAPELDARGEDALSSWRKIVEGELAKVLGVSVAVTGVPQGTFERTQTKARRVIDNRDLWRSARSGAAR